jgi:hypothetical protein
MACQRCNSERVAEISGKCSDLCTTRVGGHTREGYAPTDMGLKDAYGDYVEFAWCLDCGQIQADFPVPVCSVERGEDLVVD